MHRDRAGIGLYLTLCAAIVWSTWTLESTETILGAFGLLFIVGIGLLYFIEFDLNAYIIPFAAYIVYVFPTIAFGAFYGSDSWKYIASTQNILESGWAVETAILPKTNLFPGTQMFAALTSRVLGVEIITTAKFITPVLVGVSLITIAALTRYLGVSHRHTAMAVLVSTVYFNLTLFSTFHHARFGYLFTFVTLLAAVKYIETHRNEWMWVVLISYLLIVISHQYASMLAGLLLCGVVGVALLCSDCSTTDIVDQLEVLSNYTSESRILLLIPGVIAASYYVFIGAEFIRVFVALVSSSSEFGPPIPSTVLTEAGLEPVARPTLIETLLYSQHIHSIWLLGLCILGLVWLGSKEANLLSERRLLVIVSSVGIIGMLAVFGQILPFFSGLRRPMRYAVPLMTIFLFGLLIHIKMRRPWARRVILVTACIFILLNISLYPGYIVGDGTLEYENKNSVKLTHDHRHALDFAVTRGDIVYGDTISRFYSYQYQKVAIRESPYVYAGKVDRSGLIVTRERQQQILHLRTTPGPFRVTDSVKILYQRSWSTVFDGGNTKLRWAHASNETFDPRSIIRFHLTEHGADYERRAYKPR